MPSDVQAAILKSTGQGVPTWYWFSLLVLSLMNKQVVEFYWRDFYLVRYSGMMDIFLGMFFAGSCMWIWTHVFTECLYFFLCNTLLKTSTEAHRRKDSRGSECSCWVVSSANAFCSGICSYSLHLNLCSFWKIALVIWISVGKWEKLWNKILCGVRS